MRKITLYNKCFNETIINIKINAIQSADYETNPNCANEHFIVLR